MSFSLWASLRSLATTNNVVELSLNGKSLSWLATYVACHWSRVSCEFGSRTVALLLYLIELSYVGEVLRLSSFFAHGGHW